MPTTLYASTDAGLLRSEDEGQSWEAIDLPVEGVNIISLAVDANNDILYAGGDEIGLFFSEDKGQTWTQSTGEFNGSIRALAVDPQTDNVYAGVGGFGIYLSTNRGRNWALTGALPDDYRIFAMQLDPVNNAIYLGAENRVLRTFDNGQTWQDITSNLPDAAITGLHLDLQNKLMFVSSLEGVYRSIDDGSTWQQTLPGFIAASLLSVPGLGLFVGVAGNGGVYHTEDNGDNWSLAGAGVGEIVVTSLMFDPETAQLYAGTSQQVDSLFRGVFEGTTIVWSPVGQAFSQRTIFALAAAPEPPPLPDEVEILSSGLYWKERFPAERGRINASREALQTLRGEHKREQDGKLYPWRLGFLPATQLPALLRFWLRDPLDDDDSDRSPPILSMLPRSLQTQAIFGIRGGVRDNFENELQQGPIIKMEGRANGRETQIRHYSYQQIYKKLRVVGGSVRIHGMLGDRRVAVTSSYFPIPAGYQFVSDPTPEEESGEAQLTPRLSPQETEQKAIQAVIQTGGIYDKQGAIADAIERALAAGDSQALTKALVQADQVLEAGLGKLLIPWAVWMLQQGAPLQWLGMRLTQFVLLVTGLRAQTITAKIVNIGDRDLGIMAFAAAYHLISRVRVQMGKEEPWYVDVDRKSGQIVGSPWQAIARTSTYYKDSGEATPPNILPTGTVSVGDLAGVNNYLAGLPSPAQIIADPSAEVTNVAFYAKRLHDHLIHHCGVTSSELTGTPLADGTPQPGLKVKINTMDDTGFYYGEDYTPEKEVHFEQDSGIGLKITNEEGVPGVGAYYFVYKPTLDPELLLHEFVHAFFWMLNHKPWDTPSTLGPFGRAIQEGYAYYLARSIAVQHSSNPVSEQQQIWARAAYPANKRGDNSLNWGTRWKLGRAQQDAGADLLPAPNMYPAGRYDIGSLLNYDVGMVWARALWDLRERLGWNRTDFLAVQAYPYLHGYIANFELAAEAMLDVDIKEAENVNLENGSQPIWAMRGIAAGQGIHAFTQASNKLISATDAGVLNALNSISPWIPEPTSPSGVLSGVVAVAAHANMLYAAAQLPPPTGTDAHWKPNIYSKDSNDSTATWQPVGDWANDTANATPLSMIVLSDGTIIVGTSRGAYRFVGGVWTPIGNLETQVVRNAFSALGFAIDKFGDLLAITPTSFRRIMTTALAGDWEVPTSFEIFNNSPTVRPTSIVEWKGDIYIGTLRSGLWKVNPNFSTPTTPTYNTTDAILALAADNTTLYIATDKNVFRTKNGTAFTPLSLPQSGAIVINLLVASPSQHLLAGTLAHGIWRYDGTSWLSQYTPPLPSSITLKKLNETALLSLAQPTPYDLHYSNAAGVSLVEVVKPDFPPVLIPSNSTSGNITTYNLSAGPTILVLKNTTNNEITLQISENTDGDVDIS